MPMKDTQLTTVTEARIRRRSAIDLHLSQNQMTTSAIMTNGLSCPPIVLFLSKSIT
jgi:hypothetical protein